MTILPWNKASFYTSQDRKDGLKIKVTYEAGSVYSDIVIDPRFADYNGFVDRSLVFGIMDELIWYTIIMELKKMSMTKKVAVEFYKPLRCNVPYRVKAVIDRVQGKEIFVTARVQDADGKRYIEIKGIFSEFKNAPVQDFLKNFDFRDSSPEIRKFFRSLGTN
jgi:acyl-coenzyme A thioesterase PaaI-like protein